jgi:antitoxin component HigA of HigAB toxin-antitoxin module
MNLIAKNKIADYIRQHPEAQAAFLTWLKEHPEREAKSIAHMLGRPHMEPRFTIMTGVGTGDYQVEYRTNYPLKTTYLVWVGSRKEMEAREQAKIDKMHAENPGLQTEVKVKITEVVLIPPPPIPFNGTPTSKTVQQAIARPVKEPIPIVETPYIESDNDLKTAAEYEAALAGAIAVFESEPGTPEFDELAKLVPLIAHYEQSKLGLPKLTMLDVVKYKMEMLEIMPQSLPDFVGTAEEIDLFLAGKQSLTDEKLERLYDFLWIKFRV